MNYQRIVAEVLMTPWALMPEKLEQITALLLLRAEGLKLSQEEIAARVQGREAQRPVRSGGGVTVLPVYGVISHRMNMMAQMSGGTSVEQLQARFREALADPKISSIVLDVDSPGGSVAGIQELADEIYAARGQKRIVAQVNPLAASAAYWLAAAAPEIVATPSGAAGSIGVYTVHEDVSKALADKGVKVSMISAGKYKVEGNSFEPLSDSAREYMQARVDQYYDQFVGAVARGRGVTAAIVRGGYGQGRVLGAQDALAAGMVDRVATLDQTIDALLPGGRRGSIALKASSSSETLPAADAVEIPATAENHQEAIVMATAVDPAAAAAQTELIQAGERALAAEKTRVNNIVTLARAVGMSDRADAWVKSGASVDAVIDDINKVQAAAGVKPGPQPGPQVHLTEKEMRQYSILSGVRALCARTQKGYASDGNSFEMEVSDSIAAKLGRPTGGFYMPTNLRMLKDNLPERYSAVLEGSTGTGANVVQTTIMPQEFIELLRNLQVVYKLGARRLADLQGNVNLPKMTGAATLYWTGENPGSAVTATDQAFGVVALSPKTAMAQTVYSRQFIIQSSLDAEAIVREDLALINAIGIDLAALVGTGSSNQPKGISNQSGINTEACGTNGGAITYAIIVNAQRDLELANIPMTALGIATTPAVKAALRNKAKLSNTIALPIWNDDNTVGGWPAFATNQLPSNLAKGSGTDLDMLIAGAWNNLVIGEWGAMEIIADPYTQAGKNNVVLTSNTLVDVAVRYAQAFTVISDIDPTQ